KPYINPEIRIIKNTALMHHNIIDFPEDLIFKKEDYEILGWYIYSHEDASKEDFVPELVSFPYQLQEGDCLAYYQGYRHSVIFIAVWEYTGNATD
ncbi:MAG: hypothetical protein K2N42_04415, partial [Anaeroplasmataceae bacterium]|nr:hypothetical protein [Anaeroplasmataceae bacterium]